MSTSPSRIPVPSCSGASTPISPRQSKVSRIPKPPMKTNALAKSPGSSRSMLPTPSSSPRPSSGRSMQQRTKTFTRAASSRSSVSIASNAQTRHISSRYVAAHMGEPCTVGALDHLLMCGHKVVTMTPEDCASNCRQPHSVGRNLRSLDHPFVCLACITKRLQMKHAERVASFRRELEQVAEATGKVDPQDWISQKLEVMKLAWGDLEIQEMQNNASVGRFCHAIYVDSSRQSLVNMVARQRGSFTG